MLMSDGKLGEQLKKLNAMDEEGRELLMMQCA